MGSLEYQVGTAPNRACYHQRHDDRTENRYDTHSGLSSSFHPAQWQLPSNRDASGALVRGTRSSSVRPTLPLWISGQRRARHLSPIDKPLPPRRRCGPRDLDRLAARRDTACKRRTVPCRDTIRRRQPALRRFGESGEDRSVLLHRLENDGHESRRLGKGNQAAEAVPGCAGCLRQANRQLHEQR